MRRLPERPCNKCGAVEWKELASTTYGGHKASGGNRNETEQTILVCRECGAEGRVYVDGVVGEVTYTGALR